jgi:hypothetical protein
VRRARIVRQDASPRENHPELIENNVIQAIDLFGGAKLYQHKFPRHFDSSQITFC